MAEEWPDGVVHQLFFDGPRADGYARLRSSFTERQPEIEWEAKLLPHLEFGSSTKWRVKASALSYLTFDDGTAAVVRRAGGGGSPNVAHVLVGSVKTLNSYLSLEVPRWPGWCSNGDDVNFSAPLTGDLLARESGVVPRFARVWNVERELVDLLTVLLDNPYQGLNVVGCPFDERLAILWGLRESADGHLKSLGIWRRWSFSTYEDRSPDEVSDAPEIAFLSEQPPVRRGTVKRFTVVLGRELVDLPRRALAERLVAELLHPTSQTAIAAAPPVQEAETAPVSGTFTQPGRTAGRPVRRALSIGVRDFDHDVQLKFAPHRAHDLSQVFVDLGYDAEWHVDERMSGEELGGHVTKALESGKPEDLTVVHLVTHGEGFEDATVFALGSDGRKSGDASVAHWLTMQQSQERPTTLFLLDLCGAGAAARLPWQVKVESVRGWVIAACSEHESAYDGRFTEAVVAVLKALREGELDIDPSMPHVPLTTVARAIRREVNRLALAVDAYPQRVTATPVDISSDVEPPFFPNPGHDPADRLRLRAAVDPVKLPFLDDLDEGLDARHFLERATGLGRLTDANTGLVGCFTGRDKELRRVSPWLNGHGTEPPLCVVTGSPGAGKSALLGVLVCAASPDLREVTRPVWNRIVQAPLPLDRLAAVHARQRGVTTVVSSVARQLDLPENLTTTDLITALRTRSIPPVLVVDALDEADDPATLMNDFLLPLTDPGAPGTPVRLLVGVRHYPDFGPLFDRGWLLDLDDVDQHVLEDDLHQYVLGLLRTTVEYRSKGAVTGAFAQSVASTLATSDPGGGRRWGPFLVAGLYTRHFLAANAEQVITDPVVAADLGEKVPSDLGGVLGLDLELERDHVLLRPVLTALAHSRGAGMPVSVLTRIVPIFAGTTATTAQVRAALTVARFYLRQQMDTDRSNVYRLFHQGLADTLVEDDPEVHSKILDALLTSLGPPDQRDWNAAEPYLFRHIAAHAAEAGRLDEIESDPGLLLHPDSSLALTAATDDSHAAAAVAANARLFAGIRTPAELALAAVREGRTELARRAANMTGEAPLMWQPRWSLGSKSPVVPEAVPPFRSVAISQDGTVVAGLVGDAFAVWRWPVGEIPHAAPFAILRCRRGDAVALSADGRFAAVIGDVVTWFELDGVRRSHRFAETTTAVRAAVVTESGLLGVTDDGRVFRFSVDGHVERLIALPRSYVKHWFLADGSAGAVVAWLDESAWALRVVDVESEEHESHPVDAQDTAFALSHDGVKLAMGLSDGSISVLDRRAGTRHAVNSLQGRVVTALSFLPSGELVAGTGDGSVVFIYADGTTEESAGLANSPVTRLSSAARSRAVIIDSEGKAFRSGSTTGWTLSTYFRHYADREGPDYSTVHVSEFNVVNDDLVVSLAEGPLVRVTTVHGEVVEKDSRKWFTYESRGLVQLRVGGEDHVLVAYDRGYSLFSMDLIKHVTLAESDSWSARQFVRNDGSARVVLADVLIEVKCGDDELSTSSSNSSFSQQERLGSHPSCQVVHCARVGGKPFAFSGGKDGRVLVWDLVARTLVDTLVIGRPVSRIETVQGKYLIVGAEGELLAFKKEGIE
ncbi:hypothetical protein JNUCC0626_46795 [Lentzea sp. JNUCC 0626]|uniref:hypothetical protein n=1 Tax=Lentzea sp. JNUCC 0626 TaxID=3367513 RepID=UPI00374A8E79